MKTFKITLALIVLLVLFIFSINNAQTVEIGFLSYRSPALPLFLIVTVMFLLGCLLVALLGTIRFSQMRRRIHSLEKEIETLRQRHGEVRSRTAETEKPQAGTGPAFD